MHVTCRIVILGAREKVTPERWPCACGWRVCCSSAELLARAEDCPTGRTGRHNAPHGPGWTWIGPSGRGVVLAAPRTCRGPSWRPLHRHCPPGNSLSKSRRLIRRMRGLFLRANVAELKRGGLYPPREMRRLFFSE